MARPPDTKEQKARVRQKRGSIKYQETEEKKLEKRCTLDQVILVIEILQMMMMVMMIMWWWKWL